MNWQPIETAPVNCAVLVHMAGTAGLGIYRAMRVQLRHGDPFWRAIGYTYSDEFPIGSELTHWMPLPSPPGSAPGPEGAQMITTDYVFIAASFFLGYGFLRAWLWHRQIEQFRKDQDKRYKIPDSRGPAGAPER